MKQLLALTVLLISISLNAQIVNIPDTNFKAALITEGVDVNNDGEIQMSEAQEEHLLDIRDSGINSLEGIQSFINLEELRADGNNLTEIDLSQNPELVILNLFGNNLTGIDLSQNSNLVHLYLQNNQLTNATFTLGDCPDLETLSLSNNLFTEFDILSLPQVYYFYIGYNPITSIDVSFHPNLFAFDVSGTDITELDLSNVGINAWTCSDAPYLEYINMKNGFDESNMMGSIQNVPNLQYVCADEVEIQDCCWFYIFPEGTPISSYCSFTPGGEFFTVTGNTKLDMNTNGCDVNDNSYPQFKFHVSDGNIEGHAFSDNYGDFNIYVQNGTHTITPVLENPNYFTVSPTSFEVTFPEDGETVAQDFCITPTGSFNDLEIILAPYSDAVPGFDSQYGLIFINKGNTVLSGSLSLNYDDDYMDFVSSDTVTSSQNTGSLTWDFNNLAPFESRTIQLTMNLNTPTDSEFPLNSDDILTFETEITSGAIDETPDDNVFQYNQVVVNSFDPNDKTCLQGNELDIEKVGDYLHYMVRFENTGTANATNIVVKDVLDLTRYDVSSLIPINASHDFVTKVSNGNLVEFIFEDINLPYDDANNDGFIIYKVKTLPDLEIWDVIENDAEIYFDFNFPIVTNNEQTTVVEEGLSVDEFSNNNDINIFPNPTSDILHVKASYQIESVKLFDMTGQLIGSVEVTLNNQTATVKIDKLSTGFYFLEIQSGKAKSIHKVLKN